MTELGTDPTSKPRISKKLRRAIQLRAAKGLTVAAACEEAGMSQSGYFAAMKKPHVRALLEEQTAQLVAETDRLRTHARAVAIETAIELMQNAKSETVRARMAEFLASEGNAAQVSVNVDARTQSRGYVYPNKGAQIVEICPAESDKAVKAAHNESQ